MAAENIGGRLGSIWARTSRLGKFGFFFGIAVLVAMCSRANQAPQITQKPVAPDPAIAAQKKKEQAAFTMTAVFVAEVKKALRDPDSLKWESIRANDDASVICIEYRARNGFGGMNKEIAVYANGKASQKPSAWNKNCTQPLADMMHVTQAL